MADKADEATQNMIKNLEEKYGKSLDEWIAVVNASGLEKPGQQVSYLKAKHGMTHGYANLVVQMGKRQAMADASDGELDLVANQYAGDKAALRPIYDAIIAKVNQFGKDVEVSPKRTYVSLRRNRQFALIQPSTKTRVDVGLNLKDVEPQGNLEAAGSFNAMCTHRMRLESKADVTDELVGWLKAAYDAA
jgi:predicted transport protein